MNINKKSFFLGVLSGILAPSIISANVNQIPRKISSISSYEQLSSRTSSDENQMREDFYAAGDDIKMAMNSHV